MQEGYYIKHAEIGAFQDFSTSPSTTPMFGRLLSKWVEWSHEKLGKPENINLVELGPGTGSLMKPLLGALPESTLSSITLNLVEVSEKMRSAQASSLGVDSLQIMNSQNVSRDLLESSAKSPTYRQPFKQSIMQIRHHESFQISDAWGASSGDSPVWVGNVEAREKKITVQWHEHVSTVPPGPIIVIANEFFDALPTHQFKWDAASQSFRQVMVICDPLTNDLHSTLVETATPEITFDDDVDEKGLLAGEGFEFCPEATLVATHLADRMSKWGGASLIIDYGDISPQDTLRALSKEKGLRSGEAATLPLFERPGLVDITADAHFGALSLAFESRSGIKSHPLQPQAYLLTELMGENIKEYLNVMRRGYVEGMPSSEEEVYHLAPLVDRQGMGSHFKCICAASEAMGLPLGWNMREMIQMMEKAMR